METEDEDLAVGSADGWEEDITVKGSQGSKEIPDFQEVSDRIEAEALPSESSIPMTQERLEDQSISEQAADVQQNIPMESSAGALTDDSLGNDSRNTGTPETWSQPPSQANFSDRQQALPVESSTGAFTEDSIATNNTRTTLSAETSSQPASQTNFSVGNRVTSQQRAPEPSGQLQQAVTSRRVSEPSSSAYPPMSMELATTRPWQTDARPEPVPRNYTGENLGSIMFSILRTLQISMHFVCFATP